MTTLHILGNPTGPVHILNRIDPFSIAIIKFIQNMTKLGWNCIHYSVPGCDVECESVICLNTIYPNNRSRCIEEYNKNAGKEIAKRKKPGDLIMCFHGWENKGAAEANNDLPIVEPYIAYDHAAVFAPYRVFVSYATMHLYYGHHKMLMTPSWFDAVITNGFTPDEFEFNADKEDYILYFGRIVESKGLHIAIQATERAGQNLIIAGPGNLSDLGYSIIPSHVTVAGVCDVEKRKELMKYAKAIIGPTHYIEPFGNMIVEGYLSGTPAITSDWGGFTETVVNGVTGFRCREMQEFVNALNCIYTIDPYECRKYAMANYTEEVVYKKYHNYFNKILSKDFYRT